MSERETTIRAGGRLTRRLAGLVCGLRDQLGRVTPGSSFSSPVDGFTDSQIDGLAREVFKRLRTAPQREVASDPQQTLMDLSAQVSAELDLIPGASMSVVAMQSAVNNLPGDTRQILCRFVSNRTYQQIAQDLQVPPETVMRKLILALLHLRLRQRQPAWSSSQVDPETKDA